jgi:hypothetical protein
VATSQRTHLIDVVFNLNKAVGLALDKASPGWDQGHGGVEYPLFVFSTDGDDHTVTFLGHTVWCTELDGHIDMAPADRIEERARQICDHATIMRKALADVVGA